jgi:uncharacterized membrane protein YeaQ/YmgE (transglycosylase-associated protein family)
MDLAMVATSILVGLLTGWLAGFVITGGGYGLVWNLILGLAGSGAASVIFSVLGGGSPGTATLATAVVAFVGAALVIVTLHKIWPAHA